MDSPFPPEFFEVPVPIGTQDHGVAHAILDAARNKTKGEEDFLGAYLRSQRAKSA